jgi:hypothetical protein
MPMRCRRSGAFAKLSPANQDAVLTDMEKKVGTRIHAERGDVLQSRARPYDPGHVLRSYYGGNANFVGWDLIGYPGIRMAVSEDEQRL